MSGLINVIFFLLKQFGMILKCVYCSWLNDAQELTAEARHHTFLCACVHNHQDIIHVTFTFFFKSTSDDVGFNRVSEWFAFNISSEMIYVTFTGNCYAPT
jgi:hypothetical protein